MMTLRNAVSDQLERLTRTDESPIASTRRLSWRGLAEFFAVCHFLNFKAA